MRAYLLAAFRGVLFPLWGLGSRVLRGVVGRFGLAAKPHDLGHSIPLATYLGRPRHHRGSRRVEPHPGRDDADSWFGNTGARPLGVDRCGGVHRVTPGCVHGQPRGGASRRGTRGVSLDSLRRRARARLGHLLSRALRQTSRPLAPAYPAPARMNASMLIPSTQWMSPTYQTDPTLRSIQPNTRPAGNAENVSSIGRPK